MDVPTGRSEMPRYQFSKVDQQIRDIVDLIDHLHLYVHLLSESTLGLKELVAEACIAN